MKKHIIKVTIINGMIFGCLIGMELQPRNPDWRCLKHTKSKGELFKLGLFEGALGSSLALFAMTDNVMRCFFANNANDTIAKIGVMDSSEAQKHLKIDSRQPVSKDNIYALGFSICLLCDAAYTLSKGVYYEEYINRTHAIHNCLADHQE